MVKESFIYRIDSTDTIVSISDNWSAFANANAWRGSVGPEGVVGRTLWDFIEDIDTRQLYRDLFGRIRGGMASRPIPFRCDSADERRHLELMIKALPNEQLEISSTICETESRSPVSLLDVDTPRSSEFITVCSMCKKVKVSPSEWNEIEEGLALLRIFEAGKMPQLSHGVCPSCFQVAMKKLDDSGTPNTEFDPAQE